MRVKAAVIFLCRKKTRLFSVRSSGTQNYIADLMMIKNKKKNKWSSFFPLFFKIENFKFYKKCEVTYVEIKINNKGIKVPSIYMNLGFVFSQFAYLSKADNIYPVGFRNYYMTFLTHM